MPSRFRFALFTDQHFGPPAYFRGKLRKLSHEAGRLTSQLVETMNRVEKPDLVVNLGDVVEDASREADLAAYGDFVARLAALQARVVHVAGNHNQVNLSDDDLRGLWKHEGPLHYALDAGGLRFLVLRTVERKDVNVRLPEEQLEWVGMELGAAQQPVVVLMHHPASDQRLDGNYWFEQAPHICRVAERRELRDLFERSGKVAAVFNGHVHWNHLDVIRGIPYVTLQSLTENLDDDAPGRPAAAYAVVDVEERRLRVRVCGEERARYQLDF